MGVIRSDGAGLPLRDQCRCRVLRVLFVSVAPGLPKRDMTHVEVLLVLRDFRQLGNLGHARDTNNPLKHQIRLVGPRPLRSPREVSGLSRR